MIKGTTNNTRCDARCWNAKGTDCHCSCGGKAHGSQHSLFAIADPNKIGMHLGTVLLGFGIEDDQGVSTHEQVAAFEVVHIK